MVTINTSKLETYKMGEVTISYVVNYTTRIGTHGIPYKIFLN